MTGFQNFLFYLVPLLLIPEPAWIFSRFEVGMPPSGIQRDFRTGKKSWAHHYSNRKRARGERTFSSSRHVSSLEQRLSIKFPTLVPTNTLCSLPNHLFRTKTLYSPPHPSDRRAVVCSHPTL